MPLQRHPLAGGLRLNLFGVPELLRNEGDETGPMRLLGPGKPLILLARLCLDPEGMSRDQLAAFLWPEIPEAKARASSRQALHVLRQLMGADVIESDRRRVKLKTAIGSDISDFLAAIRAENDEQATATYGGPFLAEQMLTDANEADQWISVERARFRNLFVRSAVRRVQQLRRAGGFEDAVGLLRRVRTEEPTDLAHWQLLCELLEESGATALLHAELDTMGAMAEAGALDEDDDSARRRALHKLITRFDTHRARRGEPGATTTGARGRFVGRREELQTLREHWARATTQQRGHRLLVTGHAGIGKSRLLAEFIGGPRAEGATVVWVRGRRAGRSDRYGLLTDCVTALTEHPGSLGIMEASAAALVGLVPALSRVFPGATWNDQPRDDRKITAAVRDLLATLADERPIVLVLDDLHWADDHSLTILEAATTSLEGISALVIGATRPRQVVMAAPWERVELGPLAGDQIGTLVADLEQVQLDPAVVDVLTRITGGVPLQALQALRLMATRGVVQKSGAMWQLANASNGVITISGRDLVGATLSELSADARRVLGGLSLADAPLPREQIASLLVNPGSIDDLLRQLEDLDLAVATERGDWCVAHDVVAESVLYALPLEQRRSLSLDLAVRAAQTLHDQPIPATELRRIVRWYLDAEAPDAMLDMVANWVRQTPRAPRGAALADLVLGAGASPAVRRQIKRAIPERSRSVRHTLGAVATAILATIAVALWWLQQPARLELVNVPVLAARAGVPPIFEVRDHLGRLSTTLDGDSVETEILIDTSTVGQRHTVPISNGLVVLNDLWLYESAEAIVRNPIVQVRATTARLAPTRITVLAQDSDSLWFESGVLNGQRLSGTAPILRVAPGDSITGWIRARFNSPHPGILIMMSQFSNWMPPSSDTVSVASLITPAKRAFQYIPDIRYVAPTTPGTYWLTWTFTSEPAAVWIASSTSWRCGTPVWTDGNEKGNTPPAQLAALWGHGGRLRFRKRLCDPNIEAEYEASHIPAMSIKVVVQ